MRQIRASAEDFETSAEDYETERPWRPWSRSDLDADSVASVSLAGALMDAGSAVGGLPTVGGGPYSVAMASRRLATAERSPRAHVRAVNA